MQAIAVRFRFDLFQSILVHSLELVYDFQLSGFAAFGTPDDGLAPVRVLLVARVIADVHVAAPVQAQLVKFMANLCGVNTIGTPSGYTLQFLTSNERLGPLDCLPLH